MTTSGKNKDAAKMEPGALRRTRHIAGDTIRKVASLVSDRVKIRHIKKDFAQSDQARVFRECPDDFAFYRIIGNSLAPLHAPDQAVRNLAFQLDHEPQLDRCRKFWVVNRIFDAGVRDAVLSLLDGRGQDYFEIPFEMDVYRNIDIAVEAARVDAFVRSRRIADVDMLKRAELAKLRLKRLYVMNNNGARNAALNHGRTRAKWIMPWDGNCFLTETAWAQITGSVKAMAHMPYHIVNMARLADNSEALDGRSIPQANEEPQVLFHRASCDLFDEELPYGRRPKVELLDRLGVPGPWTRWKSDPWDMKPSRPSPYRHLFAVSKGWVFRLEPGSGDIETARDAKRRLGSREESIFQTINLLDRMAGS